MKAILQFKLPKQQTDFEDACNGTKFKLFLWELSEKLRSDYKYNDTLTPEVQQYAEQLRQYIYDQNFNLD